MAKKPYVTAIFGVLLLTANLVIMVSAGIPNSEDNIYGTNCNDPIETGSVYGNVYYMKGWAIYNLPFVRVNAEYGSDKTNFGGYYKIDDIPIGTTFDVTVTTEGFETFTESVTLTENTPNINLDIELCPSDEDSDNTWTLFQFIQMIISIIFPGK